MKIKPDNFEIILKKKCHPNTTLQETSLKTEIGPRSLSQLWVGVVKGNGNVNLRLVGRNWQKLYECK